MAYKKATLGGGAGGDLGLAVSTTGGSVINMVNWGVSVISQTSAEVYVLAPPVAGCQKTIVFSASSSTVATVVKLSTNTAQTVSVLSGTGSTYTVIKKAASASTVACTVVDLYGLNTTSWLLRNVFPQATTTPTAATIGGSITMSTT